MSEYATEMNIAQGPHRRVIDGELEMHLGFLEGLNQVFRRDVEECQDQYWQETKQ